MKLDSARLADTFCSAPTLDEWCSPCTRDRTDFPEPCDWIKINSCSCTITICGRERKCKCATKEKCGIGCAQKSS